LVISEKTAEKLQPSIRTSDYFNVLSRQRRIHRDKLFKTTAACGR